MTNILKSCLNANPHKQSEGKDEGGTWVTIDNDDDEDTKDDDAVHLRWTGVNTLLSTQLQLTHTMTEGGPHTTWATPTAKAVTSLHALRPCFPLSTYLCVRFYVNVLM